MSRPLLRRLALPILGGAVVLAAAACSGASAGPTWTFGPVAAPAAEAPAAVDHATQGSAPAAQPAAFAGQSSSAPDPATQRTARLDLAIVTGDMIAKNEFPAYVPSDFSLPANATVVVTITNFDDATPLPTSAQQYATASGIVGGTFSVTPIDASDPNGSAGPTTTASSLDPAEVSHTFTVPALGINVPIAPHARVTFTIRTGAPGSFAWRCYDPCGADPAGWGTAMAAMRGYMQGTLTVAG